MSKYELLKPVIYSLEEINLAYKLDEKPKIFERIDNILIQHENITFPFGEICYLNFKKIRKVSEGGISKLHVIIDSLDQDRIVVGKLLLEHINDLFMDGLRHTTIFSRLKQIGIFFKYLHSNNIRFQLEKKSIQNALVNYSEYLQYKVKIYDKESRLGLTTGTAHNYQNWILKFCAHVLKTDSIELLSNHYIIATNYHQKTPTQALSNKDSGIQFSQYTSIFRRFSSIVLDHELFPLTFQLGPENYWITHLGKIKHADSDYLSKSGVFNFNEGREYTIDEIIAAKRYKKRSRINEAIKKQKQQTEESNAPYSQSRLFLAGYACKAYFMHFLFLTGENDSTAASLLFNNKYKVENSNINFKSIKWRANGRSVKYDIQSEFINDFKVYLRLRSYLLKHFNEKHQKLFLNIKKQKLVTLYTSGKNSSEFNKYFSGKFIKNNFNSTSKSIRVTKGLWIRSRYGSSLSSYILQHSEKTANANYTSSNVEKSSEELTNYYSQLSKQLLLETGKEKSTPSGNCIEPNMPQEITEIIPTNLIPPDCRDQKSCLYCSKYRVHGDEIDIRKLLSMQYVILQSEHIAHSVEHFKKAYEFVLTRIDAVLCQIKELGKEQTKMINKVKKQVFEQEELSGYWYRKLELLDKLGVL